MRLRRLDNIFVDSPVYFLTLNAHDRKALFANPWVHEAFRTFCEKAQIYGVSVGRYVLMPEHLHLFAAFEPNAVGLSRWVKSLKNSISKCLRQRGIAAPHWQKDFFDHLLRTAESYDEKWEYVRQNPVRAGLVKDPDDWEFQGEICEIQLDNDCRRS